LKVALVHEHWEEALSHSVVGFKVCPLDREPDPGRGSQPSGQQRGVLAPAAWVEDRIPGYVAAQPSHPERVSVQVTARMSPVIDQPTTMLVQRAGDYSQLAGLLMYVMSTTRRLVGTAAARLRPIGSSQVADTNPSLSTSLRNACASWV